MLTVLTQSALFAFLQFFLLGNTSDEMSRVSFSSGRY